MRTPLFTLAALSLGAAAFAFSGEEATPVALQPTALSAALDSISTENIAADLHFFASDEMAGRDTPSPEQRIAARFLAARLGRLGWEPGAQEGSWFWEYELPMVAVDDVASHLTATVEGRELRMRLGEHYTFSGRRPTVHDVSANGIVYAGALSDAEVEAIDLEGHWMLVRADEGVDRGKIISVARKGKAAGILVAPGTSIDAAAMTARVEEYTADMTKSRLSRGSVGESRSIPYVYITEDATQTLLQLGGLDDPKAGDAIDAELREARVVDDQSKAELENVIGIWPGSDPVLKDEVILLSAHYDHVGTNADGEVFNGADDNGSGSMCLLNVAEALTHYGPMRRTVMILWVSGEEKGLLGSAAWTKDPYLPEGMTPILNINIDMVGRNAPEKLMITPTSEHEAYNGLTRLAEQNRAFEGFDELASADAYWSRSDHANFSRNLEIPVAFLFSDVHEDYHQLTDTPDKIDYDKVRRVARLVVRMLDGLQADVLQLD